MTRQSWAHGTETVKGTCAVSETLATIHSSSAGKQNMGAMEELGPICAGMRRRIC